MMRHSLSAVPNLLQTAIPLKIMATTDLHMHVLGYDYFADRPSERIGLSRVAGQILAERGTADNCLLFDNGDSLQGSPMGDFLAETGAIATGRRHPAIVARNALGYDAATIGNHDFSFGLPFLRRTLEGAQFPVVASNLSCRRPLPLTRHAVLTRTMRDRSGAAQQVRVGVLGFMPPQTVDWEPELRDEIAVADILASARQGIAALHARGADLIVALSHSGIGALQPAPMMENAATALAALPGIDVVIAGHTHRVFPSADHPSGPGVDAASGTLAGKPSVMPGFWGSHLGVIELELEPLAPDAAQTGRRWTVAAFRSRAEPIQQRAEHALVTHAAGPAHRQTLRHFRRLVGRSEGALTSHFTLIGEDAGLRLVAMAQRWHVRKALAGSRWQDLPILSAAAPFRAGGRGGPDHYTEVPAGRLTLRNLADLYLFPNRLCAILVTGARLADWLERSASLFFQVVPGRRDQPLIDPEFPGYSFDLIDGLDWRLDLGQPPRHAADGRLLNPRSVRVTDLRHRGQPVDPDQPFILATNSYRLSDSGLFAPAVAGCPVVLDGMARTREVIRRYVARRRVIAPAGRMGWGFCAMPGTSVLFKTGPGAANHLDRLPLPAEDMGLDDDGFLTLRLHL